MGSLKPLFEDKEEDMLQWMVILSEGGGMAWIGNALDEYSPDVDDLRLQSHQNLKRAVDHLYSVLPGDGDGDGHPPVGYWIALGKEAQKGVELVVAGLRLDDHGLPYDGHLRVGVAKENPTISANPAGNYWRTSDNVANGLHLFELLVTKDPVKQSNRAKRFKTVQGPHVIKIRVALFQHPERTSRSKIPATSRLLEMLFDSDTAEAVLGTLPCITVNYNTMFL